MEDTIPARFLATVGQWAGEVAIREKAGDEFRQLTFGEYADRATRLAAALRALGRGPRGPGRDAHRQPARVPRRRHRGPAARRHADLDLQLVVAGADPVPRRPRPGVGGHRRGRRVPRPDPRGRGPTCPRLRHVVVDRTRRPSPVSSRGTSCSPRAPVDLERRPPPPRPTTSPRSSTRRAPPGPPKGVMLDHPNICWTVDSLRAALGVRARPARASCRTSRWRTSPSASPPTTAGSRSRYEVTTCADIRFLGAYARRDATRRSSSACRARSRRSTARCRPCSPPIPVAPRSSRRRSRSAREVAAHRARGEALSVRAGRGVRDASTPSRCGRRAQLLGLDELRIAVTAARAHPRRGAPVLPRRSGVPLSEMYGLSESTGPMTWDAGAREAGHRRARDPRHGAAARRRRRGARPRRQRVPRLPRRSRAHRRGARRRRLAPHRRHRRARRRRLPAHRRPQEGAHHHRGRQEHLAGEPRGRAEGATAHRPGVRRRRRRALHRRAARARSRRRARVGARPRCDRHDARRAGGATRWCWPRSTREVDDANERFSHAEQIRAFTVLAATSGCPTPRSSRRR